MDALPDEWYCSLITWALAFAKCTAREETEILSSGSSGGVHSGVGGTGGISDGVDYIPPGSKSGVISGVRSSENFGQGMIEYGEGGMTARNERIDRQTSGSFSSHSQHGPGTGHSSGGRGRGRGQRIGAMGASSGQNSSQDGTPTVTKKVIIAMIEFLFILVKSLNMA